MLYRYFLSPLVRGGAVYMFLYIEYAYLDRTFSSLVFYHETQSKTVWMSGVVTSITCRSRSEPHI